MRPLLSRRAGLPRVARRVAFGSALVLLGAAGACRLGRETLPAGASQPWAQMNDAERMAHMTRVVEPAMKARFQRFDATRFATFDCKTCHGQGATDGTYAMPNPALPKLREARIYREHRKAHPQVTKFMWTEVVRGLAHDLGTTYGPKGHVDCGSCHIVEPAG